MEAQTGPHILYNLTENESVCEFCEGNIQNEAKHSKKQTNANNNHQ